MIVMAVLQPTFGVVCGNYWVLGLYYRWPTTHRWMGRPNVLIRQWNKLSAVLWLSMGSLRNDGVNSLAQLNWLSTQLFRILQLFHPVNWFLARSCIYPLMLWWVQLAMCQLHRILLSNSVSWLLLFVHLCMLKGATACYSRPTVCYLLGKASPSCLGLSIFVLGGFV